MYKPHTIEQFKIHQYMKANFEMDSFILSPLSRTSMMLEDATGEKIAFEYQDGEIRQIPVPEPINPEQVRNYVRSFKSAPHQPVFRTFEDATRWWLNTPNPLSYQQLFGMPDDMYRHFLTRRLLDDEEVMELVSRKVVSELEYNDIRLWYWNGNSNGCWLGPYGVDGTGNSYQLIFNYRRPTEQRFLFYVKDEYYCFMNGLPYPYEDEMNEA